MATNNTQISFDGRRAGVLYVDLLELFEKRLAASNGSTDVETNLEDFVEELLSASVSPGGGISPSDANFLRDWAEALESAARRLREAAPAEEATDAG